MLEFDPAAIGRLAVDDIMDSGMQTSPMPPVRNTEPASAPASSANAAAEEEEELRFKPIVLASEKADGVPSTDNSLPQQTPPVRVNPSAPANTSGVATEVTGGMIAAMKPVLERTQTGKEKVSEAPAELEDLADVEDSAKP
ncbi:hypothetical protein R1sor_010500 [Riccia sorocarpa]|uniref:Uncharacterized protein n=1 Tax=Riccia sorocarpa TaxID=122646 RepID=A0ABD3I4B4_9MARC